MNELKANMTEAIVGWLEVANEAAQQDAKEAYSMEVVLA